MEGGAAWAAKGRARLEAGPLPRRAEAPGVLGRFCCRRAFPGGARQGPLGCLQHTRPAGPHLGGLARLRPQGGSSFAGTASLGPRNRPPGSWLWSSPGDHPARARPGFLSHQLLKLPQTTASPAPLVPHSQDTGPTWGRPGRSRPMSLALGPAPRFHSLHQDRGGQSRPAPRMLLEAQLSRLPRVAVQRVLPDCRLCQHGRLWSALPCPLGLRPCMALVLTGGSVLDGYFLEHSRVLKHQGMVAATPVLSRQELPCNSSLGACGCWERRKFRWVLGPSSVSPRAGFGDQSHECSWV